jgi:hypothetical protein
VSRRRTSARLPSFAGGGESDQAVARPRFRALDAALDQADMMGQTGAGRVIRGDGCGKLRSAEDVEGEVRGGEAHLRAVVLAPQPRHDKVTQAPGTSACAGQPHPADKEATLGIPGIEN